MQRNILEYLERTVRRVPNKIAISSEEGALTFRELYRQARAIGSGLLREGHSGKSVVVFMSKQPRTVAAFLGVIYSGCFYVPLDGDMPSYRIELILQSLEPAACICDETTLPLAQELKGLGRLYRYEDIL